MFLLATLDLPIFGTLVTQSHHPITTSPDDDPQEDEHRNRQGVFMEETDENLSLVWLWYGFGMAFAWEFVHRKTPEVPEFPAAVLLPPKNWGDFQWFRVEKKKNPGPIR